MMRNVFIVAVLLLTAACHKVPIGYLEADYARYLPDSILIYSAERVNQADTSANSNDPLKRRRIYQSPWVSSVIQGVLGTAQIGYEIVDVKVLKGTGDPAQLKNMLTIDGGGTMYLPLYNNVTPGEYSVSVRIFNEDHSTIIPDIYRFIILE